MTPGGNNTVPPASDSAAVFLRSVAINVDLQLYFIHRYSMTYFRAPISSVVSRV